MIDLCGIALADPIINASGTFDAIAARRAFGDPAFERFPFSAYVSKTITPAPRVGNAPPRLWEEPAAMVNSIGLPNKGLDGFLADDLPELAELPVPLIVSVMATSVEEFGFLVAGVAARDEVAGLELFRCSEIRLASEDGHAGHRGYVTDLLERMLAGDSARTAVVYACGPPAMLEAVRALCELRGVAAELAMESPMACGYGACFGCAMPLRDGGYMRLCVDGPVVRAADIETALVMGAGHR